MLKLPPGGEYLSGVNLLCESAVNKEYVKLLYEFAVNEEYVNIFYLMQQVNEPSQERAPVLVKLITL